uniref:Apple domain-containing protein n=1 Tax=Romanomermis culicivorax TaxID=13658 RepID=A0A915JGD1_ROMCU
RPITIKSYTDSCNKFNVKPGHRLADERPNTKIAWKGHWAFGCTFVGESFAHSKLVLGKCIALCQVTSECSHFNWNRRLNSTCYMRSGPATKDNAMITNDNSFACGLKMTIE